MSTACKYYSQGRCRNGNDCHHVHDRSQKPCRFFQHGRCSHGEDCRYLHAGPDDTSSVLATATDSLDNLSIANADATNNNSDQKQGSSKDDWKKIGIDCGGVIISRNPELAGDTNFFGPDFLQTPMEPNADVAIKQLVEQFGEDNIYIVSKCGENVQRKTMEWLQDKKFFQITGMKESNVHFCLERNGKALICQTYGINVLIDDRSDILTYVHENTDTIKHTLQFAPTEEMARHQISKKLQHKNTICQNWEDVLQSLL